MPDFTVDFTRVLRISGRYTIKAKDMEAAENKSDEIVSDIMSETSLTWEVKTEKKAYKAVEWGSENEEEDVEDIEVNEA